MAKQMQYAICRPAANSLHRAAHTLEQHGLHWLKFGNEYFCHSGDAATPVDWSKVEAADAGLTPLNSAIGTVRYRLSLSGVPGRPVVPTRLPGCAGAV